MKRELSKAELPDAAILITCSSHEERCEALCRSTKSWSPDSVILFHYDDHNPKRESRHKTVQNHFENRGARVSSLPFTERDAAKSLQQNVDTMAKFCLRDSGIPIVVDISVLTKRHLLMLMRWLDDQGLWERLYILYSEPGEYLVSKHIPLSFGLSTIQQIPGMPASPDLSRPLHLVLFLGYESDRARAVYEAVQPMETTLVIPYPPYKAEWEGRTENFNNDLIGLIGKDAIKRVDAVDPELTADALRTSLGKRDKLRNHSAVICPLGTKPQALGVYMYVRECLDAPALIYASPLRHNHLFFSEGIGRSWLLKEPGQ